jgi:hypothetical protein
MQIESNGEMMRCLQDKGFQDQALLPPSLHQQLGYFGEGFGFCYHPYICFWALLGVFEGHCLVF